MTELQQNGESNVKGTRRPPRRNKRKHKRKNDDMAKSVHELKGATMELKDNVFACFSESNDPTRYEKTMEALETNVATKFCDGGDMNWLIKNLEEFVIPMPKEPLRPHTQLETDIYKEEIKQYVSRKSKYEANKISLYSIVWGQCTDGMQTKLES